MTTTGLCTPLRPSTRPWSTALAAGALLVGLAALPTTASAQVWASRYNYIQLNSKHCLTVDGGYPDAYIQQKVCDDSNDQVFQHESYAGRLRIRHGDSQLCVDSALGWLTLQSCGPWSSQQWEYPEEGLSGPWTYLRELDRGECMDIPWAMTSQYWVQTYPCHYDYNQAWLVVRLAY